MMRRPPKLSGPRSAASDTDRGAWSAQYGREAAIACHIVAGRLDNPFF
jgi:hypothetical protein